MYSIIETKRDGGELSAAQIARFVRGVVDGSIPDYQISALLMAIYLRGMTEEETVALTEEMTRSGETLDLSPLGEHTVDKHSTGGVGDKTTLIVAPIAAAMGCAVAKISGRGLSHTGGTVDKLESFPNYRVSLDKEEFFAITRQTGVSVIGQSERLAPADKRLYALRDVTATIGSLPLITSSIMSKKLAAGARSIVLDVKYGSGAFLATKAEAKRLADSMVSLGHACGRRVSALLSDMDTPLGYAVGNILEVKEAIALLRGECNCPDLRDVCLELAAEMGALALSLSPEEAMRRAEEALTCGRAYEVFCRWIAAQSGSAAYAENPALFPEAPCQLPFYVKDCKDPEIAHQGGLISRIDALTVGKAAMAMHAGRRKKEDEIDLRAGIRLCVKQGQRVTPDEPLAILHAATPTLAHEGAALLSRAFTF